MDPRESLRKAAGPVEIGSDWINTPATNADSYRGLNNPEPNKEATLTAAEAKFLVDTMVEESVLLKEVRRVVMGKPRVEIPRMFIDDSDAGLQASNAGGNLESTAGTEVGTEYNSVVLTSSKLVLPWTVTEEFFEDNPEGASVEQTIARLMGIRAANDLERLAINGDEGGAGPLLHANDGYIALINGQTPPAQILAVNAPFTTDVFHQMWKAMPTRYKANPRNLRFYVGPNVWSDYIDALAARMGDNADRFLTDYNMDPMYKGIPVRMIPFMPDSGQVGEGTVILTDPKNLIWGVQRDMKLRKSIEGRQAITLDQRYFALMLRCDFEVQNPNAVVMATGVEARDV